MSTDAPLVSVLLPTYNAARYLAGALRSTLTQDVADLEVVVIDDGSTDATGDVLARIDDPRVRVIRQPNAGLVAALNRGLDEVEGRFIARLDADDEMARGRLRAQLRLMAEHPDLVLCGTDYELFGAVGGTVRMPRSDRACRRRMLLANPHCGPSLMIRTQALRRSGIRFRSDSTHAEDYRFVADMSAHGKLANVGWPAYRYRVHDHQISAVHRDEQREVHLRIARDYAERIGARPVPDAVIERLLWPQRPPGHPLRRVAAAFAQTAVPAARTVGAHPDGEITRFVGRKVVEAVAAARRA